MKHSNNFLDTKQKRHLLLLTSKQVPTWAFPEHAPRMRGALAKTRHHQPMMLIPMMLFGDASASASGDPTIQTIF
jgi:hypothetical protein